MKQIFLSVFLCLALSSLGAQTSLYLQFDATCMNQLEYQYTYTGQNILMYSVEQGDNELYFFKIGSAAPITTATVPKGTVSCSSAGLNTTLIDAINAGGRLAYIVFKVQNGYLSMSVDLAGYIVHTGTYFTFRSPNYDFAMDTATLDYARNLSQPGFSSPVYLTGRRTIDCQYLYSFRLEPYQPEAPRADVEVIPSIGMISDRTGRNGSEMEQNVYRLLKINGKPLEDYIYNDCSNLSQPNTSVNPFITNPTAPNNPYQPYDPMTEPDKEGYSPQPIGMANCPDKPGFGYHIVQPSESLNSIGRIYGIDAQSLISWNNIKDANKIEVCQKIWLSPQGGNNTPPPSPGNYHVVQKGETISAIARKYNMSEATLRQLNNIPASSNAVIQPGQRLMISMPKPPPPNPNAPASVNYTPSAQNNWWQSEQNNNQNAPPPTFSPNPPASGNPNEGISKSNNPSNAAPTQEYIVRQGENMGTVAKKFGMTVDELSDLNNIPPDASLTAGRKMLVRKNIQNTPPAKTNIPPTSAAAGIHIVQKGESISAIARKYNITEATLRQLNGFATKGDVVIKTGQQLVISKGGTPATYSYSDPVSSRSPTPPGGGTASSSQTYKVQKGETMASLATKFGYTTAYFRHMNRANKALEGYKDDQILKEGMEVVKSDCKCERADLGSFKSQTPKNDTAPAQYGLPSAPKVGADFGRSMAESQPTSPPSPPPATHIVQQGQTLKWIAEQYKISEEKLAKANGLTVGQAVFAGRMLNVPK